MTSITHLAIDPGLTHTGIAISHEGQLAQPLTTLTTSTPKKLLQALLALINQYQPQNIIIGQPQVGPVHQLSRFLDQELSAKLSIPVDLVNEDFSTRAAERTLYQLKKSVPQRKAQNHQIAAAHLLQNHLANNDKMLSKLSN